MGGVLTLDAAFLGSVPADLKEALISEARADCGYCCVRPLSHYASVGDGGISPRLVERRSIPQQDRRAVFSRRPCLRGGRGCGVMSVMLLRLSAAVEPVHNFTLLHDDVMDGDATRRDGRRYGVCGVWAASVGRCVARHGRSDTDRPDRRR